jgi:hypothetical protein
VLRGRHALEEVVRGSRGALQAVHAVRYPDRSRWTVPEVHSLDLSVDQADPSPRASSPSTVGGAARDSEDRARLTRGLLLRGAAGEFPERCDERVRIARQDYDDPAARASKRNE